MSFSILFQLTVLSALSSAALGQMSTLPPGCRSAHRDLVTSACYGSNGITGFSYTLVNLTIPTIINPLVVPPPPDKETQRALTNYYDHLCSNQDCINSYARVVSICFGDLIQQLGFDVAQLVDYVVHYSCATNDRGQYCAIAQLENFNDFETAYLCTLKPRSNLFGTDNPCPAKCGAIKRVRASVGCCINNYFCNIKNIARSSLFRGVNTDKVYTECGETDPDPKSCSSEFTNPLGTEFTCDSGRHTMCFWGLLAAVLVILVVII